MCTVSMIFDHYQPLFPQVEPAAYPIIPSSVDLIALQQLIEEFRECLAAAKKVDVLTKQPDCEDPEKAKLLARVDELEKALKKEQAKNRSAVRKMRSTRR